MHNSAKYDFEVDDVLYKTVEHYYQSMKFANSNDNRTKKWADKIVRASTAKLAVEYGTSTNFKIDDEWQPTRVEHMRRAIRAKFADNDDIREKLIDTGDVHILFDDTNDGFWGSGPDGCGKNQLGRLLMDVRKDMIDLKDNESCEEEEEEEDVSGGEEIRSGRTEEEEDVSGGEDIEVVHPKRQMVTPVVVTPLVESSVGEGQDGGSPPQVVGRDYNMDIEQVAETPDLNDDDVIDERDNEDTGSEDESDADDERAVDKFGRYPSEIGKISFTSKIKKITNVDVDLHDDNDDVIEISETES
jgi:ribA/ribD-fused uncharacterized protein